MFRSLAVAVPLAAAIVLQACAQAPASTAAPAASSAPAAQASSSATAEGPIKIGLDESLVGTFATIGADHRDAFELFWDSVHDTVAGRKVEIDVVDDTLKPDVGVTKAKQLVESDRVAFLAGVHFGPVCAAIAGYARQAQVPLVIGGNCPNQNLTVQPAVSPYVLRFTENATTIDDPAADYAYKSGFRKVISVAADTVAGFELTDAFASTFIKRGGRIVQEIYAPIGTADWGPYLAQLDQSADLIVVNPPGADALRFAQQYANYAPSGKKPQLMSTLASINTPSNVAQLKDTAIGLIGVDYWCDCVDTPLNQAFMKAWKAKYPGRHLSNDAAQGWSLGQILDAAITKIDGKVEDKQAFIHALQTTTFDTAKGPVKLDTYNDVVENVYVTQVVKEGGAYDFNLLETYKQASRAWDRSAQELAKFPWDKMKGKWTGMTKEQLDQLLK